MTDRLSWLRETATWCEKHMHLISLISALGAVGSAVVAAVGIWYVAAQIRLSTEDANYADFGQSVDQLDKLLTELKDVESDSPYEPIVIMARPSGVYLALDGQLPNAGPLFVDEREENTRRNSVLLRLQRPGGTVQQNVCGGTEVVYQAVRRANEFLTPYQKARNLEPFLQHRIVSSQYLTMSKFAFAFAGAREAENFLAEAIEATERSEDGPSKSLMMSSIASIKVMYQSGDERDAGRKLFREAETLLETKSSAGTAVCLVDLYQSWASAEFHVRNLDEASTITEKLFAAIDRLPAQQSTKNRYIVDAAAELIVEMEFTDQSHAEIPLPPSFRLKNRLAQWQSLKTEHLANNFDDFSHYRIRNEKTEQGLITIIVAKEAISNGGDLSPVRAPELELGPSVLVPAPRSVAPTEL